MRALEHLFGSRPARIGIILVEVLFKHTAAGLMTSRAYESQPVDALEVLVDTRASRDASQRRVPPLPLSTTCR
jgi:hypothetical protein